jgi:FkbM family methyltransferase
MRSRRLIKFNDLVLKLAFRVRGFNNFRTLEESGERYFIDQLLKPMRPMLCLDVGANVGDYSEELLKSTSANVIAFEPLSVCHAALLSIQAHYPERLTIVRKAVGQVDGRAQIHFDNAATAHASLSEDVKQVAYVSNRSTEAIDVVSLDSYFSDMTSPDIDLLKIDTEGFEFEVLKGAAKLIAKNPPKIIQIEFNWHQLFRNQSLLTLAKLLAGYEVFQLCHGRVVRRDPADSLSNIFLFSNYVFVRKDVVLKFPSVLRDLNR